MDTHKLSTFFSDFNNEGLPGFAICSAEALDEPPMNHSKVMGNVAIQVLGVKREFQFVVYSGFEVDELQRVLNSRTHGKLLRTEIWASITNAAKLGTEIKHIDLNGKRLVNPNKG